MGFSLVVVLRLLILVVSHGAQALGAQVSVVAAQSCIVGSSWSRDWTCISCIGRPILYHWATRQALKNCISEIYELCDVIKPKQINTFPSCLSSVPTPAEGRSSPTNTPVFPPSSFVLLSFAWFYIFFPTGQVLLSALSWYSACTSVSKGVFLLYLWREMYSTSTYSSAILSSSSLLP